MDYKNNIIEHYQALVRSQNEIINYYKEQYEAEKRENQHLNNLLKLYIGHAADDLCD